jgi:hypothetical protein
MPHTARRTGQNRSLSELWCAAAHGLSKCLGARSKEFLERQFRDLARHLTQRNPMPQPKRIRSRAEDSDRGFRRSAANALRRTHAVYRGSSFLWNTLSWLQLWEGNDTVGCADICQEEPVDQDRQSGGLSPQP